MNTRQINKLLEKASQPSKKLAEIKLLFLLIKNKLRTIKEKEESKQHAKL